MNSNAKLEIAVFEGDGIGQEITEPCLDLLAAACEVTGGFQLNFKHLSAGAGTYLKEGNALPRESLETARTADAILLAAMGLPDVRYPDGTEIAPQLDLRFEFGLYAGVRPVRSIPRTPQVLASPQGGNLDFVLIRESTEGLFASRGKGVVEGDQVARDTQVITRPVCERLFDYAFGLAAKRKAAGHKGLVTCVDKANVFTSFAFFRQIFDERAKRHQDLTVDHAYVDATALNMIRHPWDFDVMVTENMFGDILSDLAAGLIGGMGMAPSADIGDEQAVFQPCHGSAPDIAGQGKANPTAMFLSAAMMLEWLAEQKDLPACAQAGAAIRAAVDQAFASGEILPPDLGGSSGTVSVTDAVMNALRNPAVPQSAAL